MEFTPKTLADLNIEGVSDYNGGRFTPDSYVSSSQSTNHSRRNSHNTRAAMYSSQQNLSSIHNSHTNNHTHNNNNGQRGQSNFSRGNKVYGSTSNIAILQKNLNGGSFSLAAPHSSSVNKTSRNSNNNNNVDNWLNAWDHPPQHVPSAPVAAKRSQTAGFNSGGGGQNFTVANNNNNNLYNIAAIPLKPLSLHTHSNQRVNNDPWAGLAFFFLLFLIFLRFLVSFWPSQIGIFF